MVIPISTRFRGWCVGLAAAGLLSGCASVSLSSHYNPPPIQMPGAESGSAAAPAQPTANPGVEVTPVTEPALPQPIGPQGAVAPVAPNAQNAQNADVNLVTLSTRMDGDSVVPPVATGASGRVDAIYNRDSMLLRWKASWDGLSSPIVGIQFSGPAGPGQNAPAVMIWPGPFGVRYEGHATLTPQQRDDLLGGRWYVVVMTANYPQGELRGQMGVVY